MKKKRKEVEPHKEVIIEEIAIQIARYKKQPEDLRTEEEIADTWFDFIYMKLDYYCRK